jgi:hypothetical protein
LCPTLHRHPGLNGLSVPVDGITVIRPGQTLSVGRRQRVIADVWASDSSRSLK